MNILPQVLKLRKELNKGDIITTIVVNRWNNIESFVVAEFNTCLMSPNMWAMKDILKKLEVKTAKVELEINITKNKDMRLGFKENKEKTL